MQQSPVDAKAPSGWSFVLALVLGGMLAWEQGVPGLIAGLLLGYLFGRVLALERRIDALVRQQHLDGVVRKAAASRPDASAAPEAPHPSPSPVAREPDAVAAAVQMPVAAAPAAPVSPPAPKPAPPITSAHPAPAGPPDYFGEGLAKALRWLKGGNPLARAGIVILFFGLAFLAKYAAEHAVLPLEVRFVMIAATALTLLIVGWRLRTRRRLYAHLLQGGGVAALYLTVFAATRLYSLLPVGMALGMMVVIAVAAALLAVLQNSLPLAVIGTTGGFLAPLLVSTGSGNHVALFSYYAVLNLGVFAVAWFRAWRVLNLIGFVFTFGVSSLFRATRYTPDDRFSTDAFLILFFLMYVAISVLFSIRQKPNLRGYVSGSLVFGLPVAAFALHASLVESIPFALAWSALAVGVFYLLLAWGLYRSADEGLRLLSEAFAALGVIFGSLAVPFGFDAQATSAMWAVEGAGLLWLGVRQQRLLARLFGVLVQLFAGVSFLIKPPMLAEVPVFNSGYLGVVMLALAGGLSAWWLRRGAEHLRPGESGLSTLLLLWGALWWIVGSLVEIDRGWPDHEAGLYLAFFASSNVAMFLLARRLDWNRLGELAFGLMIPATAIGLLHAGLNQHPLAEAGWLGWPLLVALWLTQLRWLDRDPETTLRAQLPHAHTLTLLLIVFLLAWESSWQVSEVLYGVWRYLPWGLLPAAALWLLGSRTPMPAWPVGLHPEAYRRTGGVAVATFAAAWVLLINLASDGSPTPLAYLPLLNPLDLSIAIVMLAVVRYAASLGFAGRLRSGETFARQITIGFVALIFIWMNAMLARALHYVAQIPLTLQAYGHSALAQTSFSVFWGLIGFAAMILSSRRQWRPGWIAGAALMAVVVGKLFLFDTADSGTLARVVSFMTVGVLLLVVGYVSPLPPPRKEQT